MNCGGFVFVFTSGFVDEWKMHGGERDQYKTPSLQCDFPH